LCKLYELCLRNRLPGLDLNISGRALTLHSSEAVGSVSSTTGRKEGECEGKEKGNFV
jgi:hypothetical protein